MRDQSIIRFYERSEKLGANRSAYEEVLNRFKSMYDSPENSVANRSVFRGTDGDSVIIDNSIQPNIHQITLTNPKPLVLAGLQKFLHENDLLV